MGVLATRLQNLNRELLWDGQNMQFTNIKDNDEIKVMVSDDFHVVNGDPKFDTKWSEPFNAKAFAAELIKHNYRDGWSLPEMPK